MFSMNRYESTQNVLSIYKFLNFSNIHKYLVLLHIYKCITQYQGTYPFKLVGSLHNTCSNNVNFNYPQFRTVLFQNSLLCFGPKLWNSLSLEIKDFVNNSNLSLFKRYLKNYLFTLQNS